MYDSSSVDYCSEKCPRSFLTKETCYANCNNYLCGYGGGHCNSLLTEKSCYSGKDPSPVDGLGLKICKGVKNTCCNEEEVKYVTKLFESMTNKNSGGFECVVDTKCEEAISNMLCAACSSNTKDLVKNGKIEYCPDYVRT